MSLPTEFDCAETFKRLADYLDRELSPEEVERVDAHLAICEICAAEYRFEATLLAAIKEKARAARAPESLRRAVLDILAKARA